MYLAIITFLTLKYNKQHGWVHANHQYMGWHVEVCYTKKIIINAKYQWYIYISYLANLYSKCYIHQRHK